MCVCLEKNEVLNNKHALLLEEERREIENDVLQCNHTDTHTAKTDFFGVCVCVFWGVQKYNHTPLQRGIVFVCLPAAKFVGGCVCFRGVFMAPGCGGCVGFWVCWNLFFEEKWI